MAADVDAAHQGALDHYRAEGIRLMAELAKVNTKGGRNAYQRRLALIDIDRVLDRYNMLRLLEIGWMLVLPEAEAS